MKDTSKRDTNKLPAISHTLTIAELGAPPTKPGAHPRHPDHWSGFDDETTEAEGWARIAREYHEGWPDGARQMGEATEIITTAAVTRKVKFEAGHVTGFDPFIPAMLSGRHDVWRQVQRRATPKAIKIAVGIGGACRHSADDLAWSGALVCALADHYTAKQVPVEIHSIAACYTNSKEDTRYLCHVPIKAAEETLLIDQLAAIIASPRTIRHALFSHMGTVGISLRCGYWPEGSGLNRDDLDRLGFDSDTVLIPQVYSREAAVEMLHKLSKGEGES